MYVNLEIIVNICHMCQEYQYEQKDESPIPHGIPTTWTKSGTELFELKFKSYLVVVDYTTSFLIFFYF